MLCWDTTDIDCGYMSNPDWLFLQKIIVTGVESKYTAIVLKYVEHVHHFVHEEQYVFPIKSSAG